MLYQELSTSARDLVLGTLCDHVVGISWLDARVSPKPGNTTQERYEPAAFLVSAFVISVGGFWFLVSAGHIIRGLTNRVNNGRRLVKARLHDLALKGTVLPPIPYNLELSKIAWIDEDETGIDVALIPLSAYYARHLIAGGTRPIDQSMVAVSDAPSDDCVMLGLPSQAKRITISNVSDGGQVQLDFGVPLIPIFPTKDVPDCLQRSVRRFHGRVPICDPERDSEGPTLTDIDGCSGGPIFALRPASDSQLEYQLVAVQSSWEPNSRVIAGCFIQPIIATIMDIVNQVGCHEP